MTSPAIRAGMYPPATAPGTTTPAGKPTAPVITTPVLTLRKFDATKLPSTVREVWEDFADGGWFYMDDDDRTNKVGVHKFWDPSFIPTPENEGKMWRWDSHNSVKFKRSTVGGVGAYHTLRAVTSVGHCAVGQGYVATKLVGMPDFRMLDVGCKEAMGLLPGLKDTSGIESDQPDKFLSICHGTDAQHRVFIEPNHYGNTATVIDGQVRYSNQDNGNEKMKKLSGVDKLIEDANSLGITTIGLEAHLARNVFSPTYEPEGNRPAKPEYYAKVADAIFSKFYGQMMAKYQAYNKARKREQLMELSHSLTHGRHVEWASKIDLAVYKYGDDFKNSQEYKDVEKDFWTLHGDQRRVGNTKRVHDAYWYEAKHPKWGTCLILGHFTREGVDEQIPHPNAYTGTTYGALLRMKSLGCDFVSDDLLKKLANTIKATFSLGNIFERGGKPTHVPYLMNGNNMVPELASPWASNKSKAGAFGYVLVTGAAAGMAACDDTGEIVRCIKRDDAAYLKASPYSGGKQTYGATSGLLYAAARGMA